VPGHPLVVLGRRLFLCLWLVVGVAPCAAAQSAPGGQADPRTLPYFNPKLPVEQRVHDLVWRMTLEEKVSQMQDRAPAIPRLAVPAYEWWNEGLHGVAFAGYATVFPQAIGMAATWNTDLVRGMAEVVSTEARAKHHQALREGRRDMFFGLTVWSPNVNIFRDPRWGRGQETYGEDPYLTGRMAVAFVRGLQGDDPDYVKVVATPKHFAVHSGPEPLRHAFEVSVSPHDLEDTYLPAFRDAVTEARAHSVMCAFNAVAGVPACASPTLLQDRLRAAWRFDGYVVSDCGAVADVATEHRYAADFAHAAAAAVRSGTDLECGFGGARAFPALPEAVRRGLIGEADLDAAVTRLFTARFRLGMFDSPDAFAYGRIPMTAVTAPEHRQLSLQAAREAIVLLKNDQGVLPLAESVRRIAVVGPTAELLQVLQGNYSGPPRDPVFPVAGIERRLGPPASVIYAQGSTLVEGFAVPIAHTALRTAEGKEGLRGEYFANLDFSGPPVLVRTDRTVNVSWDKAIPAEGLPRDNYSVRWTGTLTPPAPGDYRLGGRVYGCDGCGQGEHFRLYVDGRLLVENGWNLNAEARVHFDDTRPRTIRLEYLHFTSSAGIDLIWQPPAAALRAEAVAAAAQADVIVAFVGLSPQLEGEEMAVDLPGFSGGDRTDIALPRTQRDLLEALRGTGKPLVVVLTSGSALAVGDVHQYAAAILQAWYPGEEGGTAIAETLAGDNNPAGRLPITFHASLDDLPPFEDYSMANRTYRYFRGRPLYGFGYGLSYSRFAYGNLRLPGQPVQPGVPVNVGVDVRNLSQRAGDEVVQLYVTQPRSALTPPLTLAGFRRVRTDAGQTVHVEFSLTPRALSQVTENGERVILPGTYTVTVGGSQPGVTPHDVAGTFSVAGALTLPDSVPAEDADEDGLPDPWERQWGLDPAKATGDDGPAGDPDGDGRTNEEENAAGTHPRGFYKSHLAEGATSTLFDMRLAMVNARAPARALLHFQKRDATQISWALQVPDTTRVTLDVKSVRGLETAEFSTAVESDHPLVVDRTMAWDARRWYGAHAETAAAAPAMVWYLAEGATHSAFNLFYLLQNPNDVESRVRVRFLRRNGGPLERFYDLPPRSRTTVWVDVEEFPGLGRALADAEVSAVVEVLDGQPIVVERAMYADVPGQMFGAGHGSLGVTEPATEWFLAEGATGPLFDLFILIANPGTTDAKVEATYLLPDGTALVKSYTVGASSRFNIWVDHEGEALADTAVWTRVRSTNGVPIIVERAMWWPGSWLTWYEAHNSPGATSTGTRWALAEGEVDASRRLETFILIANTSAVPAHVTVTLFFEDGTTAARTFTGIAAGSRFNVPAGHFFPEAAGRRFGAIVESLGPTPAQLVVERAMYWDAAGQPWAAGTNALATKLQ
jgi:beta-glucosidase